jgi:hypothetical protein
MTLYITRLSITLAWLSEVLTISLLMIRVPQFGYLSERHSAERRYAKCCGAN